MARRISGVGRVTVSLRRSTRPVVTGLTLPAVPDVEALLRLATGVATDAGALLLEGLERRRELVEHKSSPTDMVTEMDRAAEAQIVAAIRRMRPDDGVLGEEGALETGTSGVRWVIDPLDGTTNYLYGFPAFAVSVAVEIDGVVTVAVVHDPSRTETFSAVRGRGAWRGMRRLELDGPAALGTALVGTGFSYDPGRRMRQAEVLSHLLSAVRDVRRAGAAALDLAWLAAGRLDAFYERGLQQWDYAAGTLIAAEAGAVVTDLDGGPPSSEIVVAAAPSIAAEFRRLLAEAESRATGS
jgi:myo-inositol-1(or 4)-monophosphatase